MTGFPTSGQASDPPPTWATSAFPGTASARERSDVRGFSSSHRRMTGARNFRVLSVSRLIHASIRPSNSLPMPMGSWRGIAPLVPPRSAEFAMLNVG